METPHTPGAPSRTLFIKQPHKFLGISESSWYRIPPHLRPPPVLIPGIGKRWLISDLVAWAESLDRASTRRKRKPAVPAKPERQPTAGVVLDAVPAETITAAAE